MSDSTDPADEPVAADPGDPTDPYAHLRTTDLADLVERHGEIGLERAEEPFARLVRSILRQQVSMQAAQAIEDRLVQRFELRPDVIADADPEALRDVGLSSQKAAYVGNVARAFLEEGWDHETFAAMDDEAVHDELTAITGVGDWTAKMFLMFCLGRADVFPVEDLGIRKGMWALYGDDLTRAEMVERAEPWRPYRSYASRYLWRAVDG